MAKETSFSLRSLLKKEKMKADRSNFIDWFRIVTIVLRREKRIFPKKHQSLNSLKLTPQERTSLSTPNELDVQMSLSRDYGS